MKTPQQGGESDNCHKVTWANSWDAGPIAELSGTTIIPSADSLEKHLKSAGHDIRPLQAPLLSWAIPEGQSEQQSQEPCKNFHLFNPAKEIHRLNNKKIVLGRLKKEILENCYVFY